MPIAIKSKEKWLRSIEALKKQNPGKKEFTDKEIFEVYKANNFPFGEYKDEQECLSAPKYIGLFFSKEISKKLADKKARRTYKGEKLAKGRKKK